MDAIFGHDRFRSDITWRRVNPTGRGKKRFANNADHLLYYVKNTGFTWNPQYKKHSLEYINKAYRHVDESGRRYRLDNLKGAGTRTGTSGNPWKGVDPNDTGSHWAIPGEALPEDANPWSTQEKLDYLAGIGRIYWPPRGSVPSYKRYLDEMPGTAIDTIWDDIQNLQSKSKEASWLCHPKTIGSLGANHQSQL